MKYTNMRDGTDVDWSNQVQRDDNSINQKRDGFNSFRIFRVRHYKMELFRVSISTQQKNKKLGRWKSRIVQTAGAFNQKDVQISSHTGSQSTNPQTYANSNRRCCNFQKKVMIGCFNVQNIHDFISLYFQLKYARGRAGRDNEIQHNTYQNWVGSSLPLGR